MQNSWLQRDDCILKYQPAPYTQFAFFSKHLYWHEIVELKKNPHILAHTCAKTGKYILKKGNNLLINVHIYVAGLSGPDNPSMKFLEWSLGGDIGN